MNSRRFPPTESWPLKAVILIGLFFLLSVFWLVSRSAFFFNDDFYSFILFKNKALFDYLTTSLDVHFAPLHRLLTAIILIITPLDFNVAIAVLLLFHIGSWVVLYNILQLIHRSPYNTALSFIYGANVYLVGAIIWWSAGAHRLPYILLALLSIWGYLRYRKLHNALYAILAILAFCLAFGFYIKALLIPAYIAGIELSLSLKERRVPERRIAVLIGLLGMMALAYVIWYVKFAPVLRGSGFPPLDQIVTILFGGLARINQEILPIHYQPGYFGLICLGGWITFAVWATYRQRINLIVLTVGFCLITLNVLALAISNRGMIFSAMWAFEPKRYYLETSFLLPLFLSLILKLGPDRADTVSSAYPRSLLSQSPIILAAAIYAAVSFYYMRPTPEDQDYIFNSGGREFSSHFFSSLDQTSKIEDKSFFDAELPRTMAGILAPPLHRSDLTQLIPLNLAYNVPSAHMFNVAPNGHVQEIHPLSVIARKRSDQTGSGPDACLPTTFEIEGNLATSPSRRVMIVMDYFATRETNIQLHYSSLKPNKFLDIQDEARKVAPGSGQTMAIYGGAFWPSFTPEKALLSVKSIQADICIKGIELIAFKEQPLPLE